MRHALRSLAKSPGYTLLAVGALALGIGANTVLFSAINTLFLRPLALPHSDRIVRVHSVFPDRGLAQAPLSWPRFAALADAPEKFSALAAMSFGAFTLTGRGEPVQLPARRVSERFFSVLGVQPVLGRTFSPEENRPGGAAVVLLSHTTWQTRFHGRPDAVGATLILDGRPVAVVGVLPPLPFPFDQPQLWAPRPFDQEGLAADLRERGIGYLEVYGRLTADATPAQAAEHLRLLHARYGAAHPGNVDARTGLGVVPLQEFLVGPQRPMFLTLLAAVGCVLLVACANVANLLLARFAARRKETAIRAALGATRAQIVRLFLAESLLTAALAGAAGILLAIWGIDLLARLAADFVPRATELALDGRVLGFAVLLSLLTGAALGLVPALHAARTDAGESLKDCSRGSTAGRRARRFRSGLLVAEVALSLVLLVAAALLADSFRRLQRVEPGFRYADVATLAIALPPGDYPSLARQAQFFEQALDRVRALPGVTHVAAAAGLPVIGNGGARSPAAAEGESLPPLQERLAARRGTATPGFFSALGIPLLRGRDFTWRDRDGAPPVVIINDVLARRLFGDRDPIGRRLITGIQSIPREIVGVFAAMKSENLAQPPIEEMFYPSMQVDGAFQTLVVRSERSAASLRAELVAALRAVDPALPVGEVLPFAQQLAGAIADRRLAMVLIALFAGIALLLAALGVYSVIAYGVSQRTHEFGIRLALGASPRGLVALVLREGLTLAAAGLALGLALSFATARLLRQLLFDVSATDPLILGGVAAFLALVAALACLVPARRATAADPMSALRAE